MIVYYWHFILTEGQIKSLQNREFILKLVDEGIAFTEVVMNLPQNATEFLDTFVGIGRRFLERHG